MQKHTLDNRVFCIWQTYTPIFYREPASPLNIACLCRDQCSLLLVPLCIWLFRMRTINFFGVSLGSSLKYGLVQTEMLLCGNCTREQRIGLYSNYMDNLQRLNYTNYKLSYLPRPTPATVCVQPTTSLQSRAIKLHQNEPKQSIVRGKYTILIGSHKCLSAIGHSNTTKPSRGLGRHWQAPPRNKTTPPWSPPPPPTT
jgi:hypothetical protein